MLMHLRTDVFFEAVAHTSPGCVGTYCETQSLPSQCALDCRHYAVILENHEYLISSESQKGSVPSC